MIDKQQLQAMGEHQAEQHMCMAKQIEDLQARLQECANGAAKMQEQRDDLAKQLETANKKIAAMAGLLRDCVKDLDCDIAKGYWKGVVESIGAELSGRLPDHVADAGKMVELDAYDAGYLNDFGGGNVGWWHDYIRSELDRAHDFYQSQMADGNHVEQTLAMVPEGWQLVPKEATMAMISAAIAASTGFGTRAQWDAMLAAAPKPEPTK